MSDVATASAAHRRMLKLSVAALCSELGYKAADEESLETLTEILQSFVVELGRSSKSFAEIAGRTAPLVGDVSLALIEMGQNIQQLPVYARRLNKMVLLPPPIAIVSHEPRRLQVGDKKSLPSYIPDHMPPFPDTHTYIKTQTYRSDKSEYQLMREKAATQRRDVERALSRFIAKTGDTDNLFPDDPYAFPLIANKPKPLPYLDALLFCDHEIDYLQDDDDKWAKKRENEEKVMRQESQRLEKIDLMKSVSYELSAAGNNISTADVLDAEEQIDNPFLRPIKMPKLKTTSRKSKFQ